MKSRNEPDPPEQRPGDPPDEDPPEEDPPEQPPDDLQGRYENLISDLLGEPGVTPPQRRSGFGRTAMRCNGKIFVMFVRGQLVLKLPERRIGELVAAGEGNRFDANKGTPMREWLSLHPGSDQSWQALALEALAFARAQPG